MGATFEAARVTGRRAWPPAFVIGFGVLLGAVVTVGVSGRGPGPSVNDGRPAAAGSSIDAGETIAPASSPGSEGPTFTPQPSPDRAPIVSSYGGPIEIQARRHPETMYVHGDVFVEHVTWVFVSLHDSASRIAGWASVSVPGGAGPGVGDGPTLRFDVELAVPSELFSGPLWIQATAYDSAGRVVASNRLGIGADGAPIGEDGHPITNGRPSSGSAARPGVFFPLLDASWEDVR